MPDWLQKIIDAIKEWINGHKTTTTTTVMPPNTTTTTTFTDTTTTPIPPVTTTTTTPTGMPSIASVGAEEKIGSNGRLPGICIDSKNQPHIAFDGSTFVYMYDKINGAWQYSELDVSQFGSTQYYNPHIEIANDDSGWISGILMKKGNINLCGIGVVVRLGMSTAPSQPYFSRKRIIPNSWDTGNLSLDLSPNMNNTLIWVCGGYWETYVLDGSSPDKTRKTNSGRMYCGIGGESNTLWVSKAAPVLHPDTRTVHAIWHVVTEAHSGYGLSYYKNSLIHANGGQSVAWADPAFYKGMGTDFSYVGICSDNTSAEKAYIACDLKDEGGMGVYMNVFDGSKMLFDPKGGMLIIDPTGNSGQARFAVQSAPAKYGGAFVTWTTSTGKIALRYVSQQGVVSAITTVGNGSCSSICCDNDGNLHIAYKNGTPCYRKIIVQY